MESQSLGSIEGSGLQSGRIPAFRFKRKESRHLGSKIIRKTFFFALIYPERRPSDFPTVDGDRGRIRARKLVSLYQEASWTNTIYI